MINHLGKLEHLAWMIQMKLNTSLENAKARTPDDRFEKGYTAGQIATAEFAVNDAVELLELVEQIKAEHLKGFMKEDVDLSGMAVDEYA